MADAAYGLTIVATHGTAETANGSPLSSTTTVSTSTWRFRACWQGLRRRSWTRSVEADRRCRASPATTCS